MNTGVKTAVLAVLLTGMITSASLAESTVEQIKKENELSNLDYMEKCKVYIDRARNKAETANYYLAATCAFDHPAFGVDGQEFEQWFKIEADKGHYGSLVNLARMYENSTGVKGNLDKALMYYAKAIKNSNPTDDMAILRLREKRKLKIENLALQNSCKVRTTEIFDTKFKCTHPKAMVNAIKAAGGTPTGGSETSIVYDSREILNGSKNLEVFFGPDGRISCMKYSFGMFKGNAFIKDMMQLLVQKYGFYEEYVREVKARNTSTWYLDDGVVITLKKATYDSTLEYCLPALEKIRLAEIEKASLQLLNKKSDNQKNAY